MQLPPAGSGLCWLQVAWRRHAVWTCLGSLVVRPWPDVYATRPARGLHSGLAAWLTADFRPGSAVWFCCAGRQLLLALPSEMAQLTGLDARLCHAIAGQGLLAHLHLINHAAQYSTELDGGQHRTWAMRSTAQLGRCSLIRTVCEQLAPQPVRIVAASGGR